MKTNTTSEKYNSEEEKWNAIHQDELGMSLPDDFFAQSKLEILKQTIDKEPARLDWFKRSSLLWKVAASIVLCIGLYALNPFESANQTNSIVQTETVKTEKNAWVQTDTSSKNNPNSAAYIERFQKTITNENDLFESENEVLIQSLFVEENEVDTYIDNYILKDI